LIIRERKRRRNKSKREWDQEDRDLALVDLVDGVRDLEVHRMAILVVA
jgi:hypothetical protein